MPEAPVHKDRGIVAWKYYIRLSWQILPAKTITVPHGVEEGPYDLLRFGVAGPDPAHIPTSLFLGKFVNHGVPHLSLPEISLQFNGVMGKKSGSKKLPADIGRTRCLSGNHHFR